MISVNEWIQGESLRHQVDFDHYSNGVVRRMLSIINRLDVALYAELSTALDRMDPVSFTVERLESLLSSVRAMNTNAYEQMGAELVKELRSFTEYEVSYQNQVLVNALPVTVHVATVSAESVYTSALARPFQGVLLKGVLKDIEVSKAKKIREAVAMGFSEGKTTSQIVTEIRGRKANGYADGLMNASRRDIEAITRTALGHMAGFVQDRTTEANASLIKAVQWSATLDLRTSSPCRIRDGRLYEPVTHKPMGHALPWGQGPGRYHWNCRSAQTYVMKSHKELGIDAPEVVMKDGTRASMDGQVPKETTYPQWLQKQSAARQDEVLGSTRGLLLRKGGLKVEDMYSSKGVFLDLAQLRERDASVFRRAGL